MPDFIESDKLFGIGSGLRVFHSWEVGLHMDAKSQVTLTVIGSTKENYFLTWDTVTGSTNENNFPTLHIMHNSTSHSNNKLNS